MNRLCGEAGKSCSCPTFRAAASQEVPLPSGGSMIAEPMLVEGILGFLFGGGVAALVIFIMKEK
jgi:hypothetical protein